MRRAAALILLAAAFQSLPSPARADILITGSINTTLTATHTPTSGLPTILSGVISASFSPISASGPFSRQQTAPDGTAISLSGSVQVNPPPPPLSPPTGVSEFREQYNFGFQGGAAGSNLASLTGQFNYSLTDTSGTTPFTARIVDEFFINGQFLLATDLRIPIAAGSSLSGTLPQSFPPGVSGLSQGNIEEDLFLQVLPPASVSEPASFVLFGVGLAALEVRRMRRR